MKTPNFRLRLIATLLCFFCNYVVAELKHQQLKKTYIIHMDKFNMPESFTDHLQWYDSSLKAVSKSAGVLYAYNHVIHGFSTRLTRQEVELLQKQQGVISVLPEIQYELLTTRTPKFLGLAKTESLVQASSSVSEVIIGILDSGIWPEVKSLDEAGLGPVPSAWKGTCEVGKNFNSTTCNRKLIGARFFSKGYEALFGPIDETLESKSPRDDLGHGTHTATTAAGSVVSVASLFGFAGGMARGMASKARVATYKVCWLGGCFGSDILAAMDMAIADGVNVISMSLGGEFSDYIEDPISIAAFRAMSRGIMVSCAAGNGGSTFGSLLNVAPWITTVGAGSLDRDFSARVILGNGKNFSGASLYTGKPSLDLLPLVYAGNVSNLTNGYLCMRGSLISAKVAGKIVICDRGGNSRVEKGLVVSDSGGLGMILANTEMYGDALIADAHLLPTAALSLKDGNELKIYALTDPKPMARISCGHTKILVKPAPMVAAFSSRGPNIITPEVLKPDLIAPGVNILAAWPGSVGPSGLTTDTRRVSFNIISGTFMSCPHVSGLAALVLASHQEWSPAAIRSALMTTAYATYQNGGTLVDAVTGQPSTPFDFGAGHVDPAAALDPGLVYDASVDDYLDFLCALNYSTYEIRQFTDKVFICDPTKQYSLGNLNYPSFAVPLQTASGSGSTTVKHTRTLTNVGTPGTYNVSLSSHTSSVQISVVPESLTFTQQNEKKSFTVTFIANSMPPGTNSFTNLEWLDGKHVVRSPIAFSWI